MLAISTSQLPLHQYHKIFYSIPFIQHRSVDIFSVYWILGQSPRKIWGSSTLLDLKLVLSSHLQIPRLQKVKSHARSLQCFNNNLEGNSLSGIRFTDLKDFWAFLLSVRYRLLHNLQSHHVILGMSRLLFAIGCMKVFIIYPKSGLDIHIYAHYPLTHFIAQSVFKTTTYSWGNLCRTGMTLLQNIFYNRYFIKIIVIWYELIPRF